MCCSHIKGFNKEFNRVSTDGVSGIGSLRISFGNFSGHAPRDKPEDREFCAPAETCAADQAGVSPDLRAQSRTASMPGPGI